MAKLAVFPKCYLKDLVEGRMSLEDWIQRASVLDVDGLELYMGFLRSHDSDYLGQIRKRIEESGLEMPMMCYSPDFTIPDEETRGQEVTKQQEAIKITAELGGQFCRTLSGQRRPDVELDEGIKWVVDAIGESLETAQQSNVIVVIENHYKDDFWEYPEFAQKAEVFLAVTQQIDSPWFGIQYDPSNAIVAGEDPLELLDALKRQVRTMHASDRYLAAGHTLDELRQADGTVGYSPHLRHGVIGQGLNDYDAIFRTLKEVGFDSWISIEDGTNGMDELHESAAFLRRKMTQWGLAESGGQPAQRNTRRTASV